MASPQRDDLGGAETFYNDLADSYHLIFQDWDATIERQAGALREVITSLWPQAKRVRDVACGIGTQSLGLARVGFEVTASDLAAAAVARAEREARQRGLAIRFEVCDMREAHRHPPESHDVVVCCDNSLAHLQDEAQVRSALRAMRHALRPGGGILLSGRDYARELRGTGLLKPYGARRRGDGRVIAFQVWDWVGESHYDLDLYVIEESAPGRPVTTRVHRSRLHALPIERIMALCAEAGFEDVQRLDGYLHQPVVVGTRP